MYLPKIAGVVGNDRGSSAQHDVPREQRSLLFEIVAKMIGRMARSKNRAQRGAFGVNDRVVVDCANRRRRLRPCPATAS